MNLLKFVSTSKSLLNRLIKEHSCDLVKIIRINSSFSSLDFCSRLLLILIQAYEYVSASSFILINLSSQFSLFFDEQQNNIINIILEGEKNRELDISIIFARYCQVVTHLDLCNQFNRRLL